MSAKLALPLERLRGRGKALVALFPPGTAGTMGTSTAQAELIVPGRYAGPGDGGDGA